MGSDIVRPVGHGEQAGTSEVTARRDLEADLQRFVQSAAMPCPYARLPTTYVHLEDPVDSKAARAIVRLALAAFWPDDRQVILVIVPRDQPRDHREAREQAYWLRYQWHYLRVDDDRSTGVTAEGIDARLRAHYSMLIADARGFLGPRVVIGNSDIMMTALNPLYDPEHPRYSPHAVFPIIRTRDLLSIHDKRPEVSFQIAIHAKCKIILSQLTDRHGIDLTQMRREYRSWLDALAYYQEFIMTIYTDSYRVDSRTLPRLEENRRRSDELIGSERFKASLVAFRVIVGNNPDLPCLRRILDQNPGTSVFDIAKVVYGDVSGMYVPA